jgi:uncharacterized membrane protein YtjA (UPF0391 family)
LRPVGCRVGVDGHRAAKTSVVTRPEKEESVLELAIVFLVIALIAAFFGFRGVAGTATSIAKFLFVLFLILFVVTLLF